MGLPDISEICVRSMPRARKRPFRVEVPKPSSTRNFSNSAHFLLLVLFVVQFLSMANGELLTLDSEGHIVGQPACGDFLESKGYKKDKHSPFVGENGIVCKWVIQADYGNVTHVDYKLSPKANADNSCQSLEFREPGCDDATLIFLDCVSQKGRITSHGRWLCVIFRSYNASAEKALQFSYSAVASNRTDFSFQPYDKNPTECAYYEFHCANKVCTSIVYKCDFVNDCGCFDDQCDETMCSFARVYGAAFSFSVGFTTGVFMMIGIVIAGLCIEKRHNWYHIQQQAQEAPDVLEAEPWGKKLMTNVKEKHKTDSNVNVNCSHPKHTLSSTAHCCLSDDRFYKEIS